jgi:hypothetical protein
VVRGTLVAAVLLAATGAAQPAFAGTASGDVPQPFAVHSGDACRMGVAKGTVVWHLPPGGRSVDGRASIVDRPVPGSPVRECGDDGRHTVLVVTARAGGHVLDRVGLAADNGEVESVFALSGSVPVEELVVQVCRPSRLPGPPTVCGQPQTLHAPVTTTG